MQKQAQDTAIRFERERGVSEIAVARGIAHATVTWPESECADGRLRLLQTLAEAGVAIFLIKLHPDGITFAMRPDNADGCADMLVQTGVSHRLLRDLGLVSTYAGAMRDLSGVIARIYRTMADADVRVLQTGDAYNAVHCLVPGDQADLAAVALREEFNLVAPVLEREGMV